MAITAFFVDEKRRLWFLRCSRFTTGDEILPQCGHGAGRKRQPARFKKLGIPHFDRAFLEIDVPKLQANDLGEAKSGAVCHHQHREQCCRPQRLPAAGIILGRLEEQFDLFVTIYKGSAPLPSYVPNQQSVRHDGGSGHPIPVQRPRYDVAKVETPKFQGRRRDYCGVLANQFGERFPRGALPRLEETIESKKFALMAIAKTQATHAQDMVAHHWTEMASVSRRRSQGL